MTVLSDTEIRTRMRRGELVPGGDEANARECGYSFLAGSAFLAGSKDAPVVFPGPDGKARVVVEPGRMIWIRTRDRVKLSNDVAGFWWQTNTLSRKGLMLVNMSMVEPGYEGDLACLFVNFGNRSVLIDPDTTIAKMVFMEVHGTVSSPFMGRKDRGRYDFELNELAIAQPSSFLQVGELAIDLKAQTASAIADVRATGSTVRADADAALRQARADAVDAFRRDIPGSVMKAAGWAAAAVALITAATLGSDWAKGNLFPDTRKVARAEAEDALRERVVIPAAANSAQEAMLLSRIEQLNARIGKLEKRGR